MKVEETNLEGVLLITPKVFGDSRGFFLETWSKDRYKEIGIALDFVQDNQSFSTKNVLRGLHFQNPNAQGKLVSVVKGCVFDVAVDIRKGSRSFGEWVGVKLSEENHQQLWIPPGFAHGFCVLSDTTLFTYKCTDVYTPSAEGGILWNDPEIGIDWPVENPILSDKDQVYPQLCNLSENRLFTYTRKEAIK